MNRLTRELRNRGIVYDADEIYIVLHGVEYDNSERLVSFTNDIIVTVWESAVTDPIFKLYEARTLKAIGEQYVYPEMSFSGSRTFGSYAYVV